MVIICLKLGYLSWGKVQISGKSMPPKCCDRQSFVLCSLIHCKLVHINSGYFARIKVNITLHLGKIFIYLFLQMTARYLNQLSIN